jgi:OOP family OmpA-OmpF porin
MMNGIKTFRVVVGLALMSLVAAPAFAGDFYAGGSLGQASTDVPDMGGVPGVSVDDSATGYKVFGGYNVIQYFAVEAAYVDGASMSMTMNDPTPLTTSFETSGFAFRAVGVLPVKEKFSLFADFGMYMWDGDATVSDGSFSASGSTDGTDPVYGLGMGWQVMPKGNLRVELERYQTDAEGVDMDVDMLSVGFAYKF